MNGRMTFEGVSMLERLAAVARTIQLKFDPDSRTPDYADYVEWMRLYVRKEELLTRIDEARKCGALALTARIAELAIELADVEAAIPAESRFRGAG